MAIPRSRGVYYALNWGIRRRGYPGIYFRRAGETQK